MPGVQYLTGSDTGSFGSLQALPSFLATFGETINGQRTLSPTRRATMNSVVWIGKFIGTAIFEPIVERLGYKHTVYLVVLIQVVGVIIERKSAIRRCLQSSNRKGVDPVLQWPRSGVSRCWHC